MDSDKLGYTEMFKVQVPFFQYFDSLDNLDIKIWFYPYGIGVSKKREEITLMWFDFPTPNKYYTSNKPSSCTVKFRLPIGYREEEVKNYENGEVLFLCRLKTEKEEYIPLEFENKARYYYTNARVYNTIQRIDGGSRRIGQYSKTNHRAVKLRGESEDTKEAIVVLEEAPMLESYSAPIIKELGS